MCEISLIRNQVKRAVSFFEKIQGDDGSICEPSQVFDVWETINACLATLAWRDLIGDRSLLLTKAALFLRSSETSEGMVLHNSYDEGYCLEASSEYVRFLLTFLTKVDLVAIKKMQFIAKVQPPNGAWKIANPFIHLQEFPSVTGFALRCLMMGNMACLHLESALRFLSDSQKQEGHWGIDRAYYGTPYYAMVPIVEVLAANNGERKFNSELLKAEKYLVDNQKKDGSWINKKMLYDNETSAELQTALALQSCFATGMNWDNKVVEKGFKWLLSRQLRDGSWQGGHFPFRDRENKKKEDIYATSQSLIAIHKYSIRRNWI